VNPDATGLNPGWRSAVGHYFVGALWPEGTSDAEIETLRSNIRQNEQTLATLDPNSGAYFNEVSTILDGFHPREVAECPLASGIVI
jgi:hypothetical protein